MEENQTGVYDEYQGFDEMFIAEVEDTRDGYVVSKPEYFAPAGEITKATESETSTKYYDNGPYLNVNSEGADTLTITVPVLPLPILAKITGKTVDPVTKALLDDGEPKVKYFALLYRLAFTDGSHRYVVRHKGSFKIGDEAAKAKDNTTDSNNIQVTFTGIKTKYQFTSTGKGSKAIIADERDDAIDFTTWYDEVVTPDNISELVKTEG